MKKLKGLSLVIAILMITAAMLTGCGQASQDTPATTQPAQSQATQATTAAPTEPAGPDISQEVKINGYLLGAAPAGFQDVMAALNGKLKTDLNATMEINYIGWSDMQSKYPLILAAGEDVDWIFTAPWSFYPQQAAKGAFMEITPEILEKYMPLHWAKVKDTTAMKEAEINGKVYMITTATPDKKVPTFLYREDLRAKYGVPEIK